MASSTEVEIMGMNFCRLVWMEWCEKKGVDVNAEPKKNHATNPLKYFEVLGMPHDTP
jgi:hypothetical protein